MATRIQFRRGTTSQHASFTGAVGEMTVDTDKDCLVVHDGSTAGGFEMARADVNNVSNPQFSGTSSLKVPAGTTAQRPSGTAGQIRYNSSTGAFEGYSSAWSALGKIVNYAQVIKTNTFSTTTGSGTFVDVTGLQANITPQSSSNKVLVMAALTFGITSTLHYTSLRILRNGSTFNLADADGSRTRGQLGSQTYNDNTNHGSIILIDSPSTTSTVSYKVQMTGESGQTKFINRGNEGDGNSVITQRAISSIVLLEIAG